MDILAALKQEEAKQRANAACFSAATSTESSGYYFAIRSKARACRS